MQKWKNFLLKKGAIPQWSCFFYIKKGQQKVKVIRGITKTKGLKMKNCLIFVGKNRILVYNIQRFKFFYNPVVFYFAGRSG